MENNTERKSYLDGTPKTETMKRGFVSFIVRGEKGIKGETLIYRNEQMATEILKEKYTNGRKGSVTIVDIDEEHEVVTSMSMRTWLEHCTVTVK